MGALDSESRLRLCSTRGIGAERTCELVGGLTITERRTAWDQGRSFTYEGSGLPLVKRAMNTWCVRPDGDRSMLVSEALVELKGVEKLTVEGQEQPVRQLLITTEDSQVQLWVTEGGRFVRLVAPLEGVEVVPEPAAP